MVGKAASQFLRFSLVGVVGFVVDTATLYAAIRYGGLGHYSGRLVSYLVAATSTWALNRRFTFNAHASAHVLREWMKFIAANALGGIVNYSVYAILIAASTNVSSQPVLGVAAGSIAGLAVNFTLSKRLVFVAAKSQT